jgi:hypothetical protein
LGFQGCKLGLVAALALFGKGLQGLSLALVGLLTEGVALFHDADVELELLLALLLPALELTAEDLQEGGASSESGEAGDGEESDPRARAVPTSRGLRFFRATALPGA